MGKQIKKLLPFLATFAVCLVVAVMLLVVLPMLVPAQADVDPGKQTEADHNQIGENPSIIDQPNGNSQGNNNANGGDENGGDEKTDPTDPTDPEPTKPVDPTPTPTEPTDPIEPEPVNPDPIDPEPEPEPEVVFELTAENLRGTVWHDEAKQLLLTFNKVDKQYTLNGPNIAYEGKWMFSKTDKTVTLKLNSSEVQDWVLVYANNKLTVTVFDNVYELVWQPNA